MPRTRRQGGGGRVQMLCAAQGGSMFPQPRLGPAAHCFPAVEGQRLAPFRLRVFRDPFSRGLRAGWCRTGASPVLLTGRPCLTGEQHRQVLGSPPAPDMPLDPQIYLGSGSCYTQL